MYEKLRYQHISTESQSFLLCLILKPLSGGASPTWCSKTAKDVLSKLDGGTLRSCSPPSVCCHFCLSNGNAVSFQIHNNQNMNIFYLLPFGYKVFSNGHMLKTSKPICGSTVVKPLGDRAQWKRARSLRTFL